MDRETLLQAIEHGPVRVTMNDGLRYEIESLRDVVVVCLARNLTIRWKSQRDSGEARRLYVVTQLREKSPGVLLKH
ncbi:hypothetical protein SH449x_004194 [Pirellulaceae bacterium SH449]